MAVCPSGACPRLLGVSAAAPRFVSQPRLVDDNTDARENAPDPMGGKLGADATRRGLGPDRR